ncbi:hypothetical protein [Candidatus Mesenet endosymbiont of Agriotes lineatus]|uniref:hypothetical protein n=1 Tax=Candidatus Mesenet endosymbiont of Agriotes lineatus TaxID=3077948 RepID=UPI0030D301E6
MKRAKNAPLSDVVHVLFLQIGTKSTIGRKRLKDKIKINNDSENSKKSELNKF